MNESRNSSNLDHLVGPIRIYLAEAFPHYNRDHKHNTKEDLMLTLEDVLRKHHHSAFFWYRSIKKLILQSQNNIIQHKFNELLYRKRINSHIDNHRIKLLEEIKQYTASLVREDTSDKIVYYISNDITQYFETIFSIEEGSQFSQYHGFYNNEYESEHMGKPICQLKNEWAFIFFEFRKEYITSSLQDTDNDLLLNIGDSVIYSDISKHDRRKLMWSKYIASLGKIINNYMTTQLLPDIVSLNGNMYHTRTNLLLTLKQNDEIIMEIQQHIESSIKN